MLNVGLTGGIAAGKSAVASRLVELGAVLIDADAIAREVVAPGTEGLAAVVEAFGDGVLGTDGALDRPALGALVFADEPARLKLNGIVHPLVRAEAARRRAAAAPGAVVVQDIPLLVETGQAGNFDLVVTVQAPEPERIRRMVQDRGMARSEAESRVSAQATDAERAAASDVVLENSGTLGDLLASVDRLWNERILPAAAVRAPGKPGAGP
ncbi:dephospho-CoA kinase [Arthrobacter sp. KK5.5]|uniref:dephospho-CoA kinase n=1 Tax=Arthrobacter sp. KK5.5 TaxID=3373084 RepID=UPI003EE4F3FC